MPQAERHALGTVDKWRETLAVRLNDVFISPKRRRFPLSTVGLPLWTWCWKTDKRGFAFLDQEGVSLLALGGSWGQFGYASTYAKHAFTVIIRPATTEADRGQRSGM